MRPSVSTSRVEPRLLCNRVDSVVKRCALLGLTPCGIALSSQMDGLLDVLMIHGHGDWLGHFLENPLL